MKWSVITEIIKYCVNEENSQMQTYSIACFCVLLPYTTHCWESQVNLFSTLLISPELFMWNDTQSQMVPSGHRTATGSVFTYVCNFTSFFSSAIIDVFLFTCMFCSFVKPTNFYDIAIPKKIPHWLFWVHFPRKDWSSRPSLISDITVTYRWPLTLLPAAFEQLPAFVISI